MGVCACGHITNRGRALCDRCAALSMFGLTRDATSSEIKDAYRTLAKVWHPDRFTGDEALQIKAEEKLKEINSAYQLLIAAAAETAPEAPQPEETHRPAASPNQNEPTAAPHFDQVSYHPRKPSPFNRGFRRMWREKKTLILMAALILIAAGGWAGRHRHSFTSELIARIRSEPSRTHTGQSASGSNSNTHEQSEPVHDSAGVAARAPGKATPAPRASLIVYPSDDPQVPYFTVGSTKQDVIRVQGSPSKSDGDVFTYGASEVYFKDGRVTSWRVDPTSPLKARATE